MINVVWLLSAHAMVVGRMRREDSCAQPIPDSLSVLSELRRAGCVASQRDVREQCAALHLPLADLDHER